MAKYKKKKEILVPKSDRFQAAILNPIQVKAEQCRRSLFTFMKEFWYEVSTSDPVWNWHLEYLSTELETMMYRVAARQPKEYDPEELEMDFGYLSESGD